MKIWHLGLLALVILNFSWAQTPPPEEELDRKLSEGKEKFEMNRFDDESVLLAIKKDMELACSKNGLCTLSAVSSNDQRFTAQFSIGQGTYLGGFNNGGGTTVIVPGSGGEISSPTPFYGVTLRYTRSRCHQTVKVPRSLYISMNRYLYGLMNEEGGTRRGFTPADEAMIMFYSTIMKQANGCSAST